MRILHLTTFLQGGAGRMITSLAVAQRRAGHDVLVVTDAGGEPGYESYPEYLDALRASRVRVCHVQSTFKRDVALNVRAAAALREVVDPVGVDIVHTHAAIPTLVARLALGRTHAPVVQTMHGWGIAKTPEQAATDIALLGLTEAVITPSRAAHDTLVRLGLSESLIRIIPYGIERDAPAAAIAADDDAQLSAIRRAGRRIAMCIGTLGERKNQRLLVEALAHPAARNADAVFIGEGDATPLMARARELGVAHRVHILGQRVDASRYLLFADAFVLPSRNEGLPVAVLEAMRAGVTIVGSAIPEIVEVVAADEVGVVFEPDDAAALALALAGALASADEAGARRHRRDVFGRRYLGDQMTDAYLRLYETVIESCRAATPV